MCKLIVLIVSFMICQFIYNLLCFLWFIMCSFKKFPIVQAMKKQIIMIFIYFETRVSGIKYPWTINSTKLMLNCCHSLGGKKIPEWIVCIQLLKKKKKNCPWNKITKVHHRVHKDAFCFKHHFLLKIWTWCILTCEFFLYCLFHSVS